MQFGFNANKQTWLCITKCKKNNWTELKLFKKRNLWPYKEIIFLMEATYA